MRRIAALFLCAAAVLAAVGCARQTPQETEGYDLYFLSTEMGGGALQAEQAYLPELEGAAPRDIAEGLMKELLRGPLEDSLKSVIPAGTNLLSLEVEDGRALVDLSASYGTLSGVALTLADYAITLTLTQVPEIGSVKITVRGQELAYRDKQTFIPRDALLLPEEDVVGTVQALVYFLSGDGVLTPEERTLELYEGDTQVSAVVRAVENGPEGKKLSSSLPEGFRVKAVWLQEDTCYVNLSSALLETLPPETDFQTAIYALACSLCSLDTVEEVRFLRDGEFAQWYGTVDISGVYVK